MKNVIKFNGHIEYFTVICFNVRSFGILCPFFVMLHQEKSGNPAPNFQFWLRNIPASTYIDEKETLVSANY
jgi:hypothetical protein